MAKKKHVVYSRKFAKDKAEYIGRTTKDRLEERTDEHSDEGENKVLQHRLQKEEKNSIKTLSEHDTKAQAEKAEQKAIESAPKVINKRGTKDAENSIYDKELKKIEKEKKG